MNSKINKITSKLKLIKCSNEIFLDLVPEHFYSSNILIRYLRDYAPDSSVLNSGNYYLINEFKKYLLFEEGVDSYYLYTTFPGIKLDIDVIDINHYFSSLNPSVFKPHLRFEMKLFRIAWLFINDDLTAETLCVGFFLSDLVELYEETSSLESKLEFENYISERSLRLIRLLKTIYKSNLIQLFDEKIPIRGFLGIIESIFSKNNDFPLIKIIIDKVKKNLKSHYVGDDKMKLYELLNFILYYARKHFINLSYCSYSDFDRYFNFINMIVMNTKLFEDFIKINEL